jgi:prolyl 4-hydroxylase
MTCDQLLIENRCPIDPDAVPAWQPGDLDAMFRRLVDEPLASEYDVQVLSNDPWVITMDGVVTDEEADRLIELGAIEGYQRSSDVGVKQADGTYGSHVGTGRTSTNAWCQNEVRLILVPSLFFASHSQSSLALLTQVLLHCFSVTKIPSR